ncbi:MAG: YedE-related selenium metabolism membrane protein [Sphaerochaetaceae bacterium]|nr:YedE-related selenium metabolism membrane protein [Sphaerochaetaceae bacterium]
MINAKEKRNLAIAGILVGVIAVILVLLGNPKNMGFCIACFIRDIAGATKLHTAGVVQYVRPEIIGIVIGAFAISAIKKEFNPRGGSSPMLRFLIGAMVMVGALVFLGCPLRMVLRLSAGDLNALVGLIGFIAGVGAGSFFLAKGFSLGRTHKQSIYEGGAITGVNVILLLFFVLFPTLFAFSSSGPGSMHAPIIASLAAGIIVGVAAQRTRLCMAGGIRDIMLLKDGTLVVGSVSILAFALIMNLITGNFKLGFVSQPVAHSAQLWNLLGMFVVGLGSVMLGGCPLRQLILAGEGNSDSAITVVGYLVGAAFAHNFGLAGSADSVVEGVYKVGGPSVKGQVACILCIVILLAIAVAKTFGKKEK